MSPIILPVPHVQQRNRGECLAACAAIVLDYIGIPIAYGRLLKLLRVQSYLGTPASNVRRLETLGLDIIYQQGTLADLYQHLVDGRPTIAFVKTKELPYCSEETDHAVVVVGLDDQFIYLNDPTFAKAPFQVPHGDFDLAWLERDEYYAAFIRR